MSKRTKYVVFEEFRGVDEVIFPFSDLITHSDFVRSIGKRPEDVISAGFCCVGGQREHFSCYGESVSLSKKARIEDSLLLYKLFEEVY